MKTLLFLIAILFTLTTAVQAQKDLGKVFAEHVMSETSATIEKRGDNVIGATVSRHYTEDLMKITMRRIVRQLSDAEVIRGWERQDEGHIQTFIKAGNRLVLVAYSEGPQSLVIHWGPMP